MRYCDSLLQDVGCGVLEHGLYPLAGDELGRLVSWGLLQGESARTVVLLSHFDTVDAADYGELESPATDPGRLREGMLGAGWELDPLARRHLDEPDEWLFGRGSVDMKSGIAAHLTALEKLCKRAASGARPAGSVLFISTPDEETESAGMSAAVRLLVELRRERGLEYVGAINTDYTTPLHADDDSRSIHMGVVGKTMPSVYVRGVETHAGEPYLGFDATVLLAEIVRDISLAPDLADTSDGEVSPPPVVLRAGDLKARYDVQAPYEAYTYINFLTFEAGPEQVLDSVAARVDAALRSAVERVHAAHTAWRVRAGSPPPEPGAEPRTFLSPTSGRWPPHDLARAS
ncbi:MAG: M20/M25/M40 family metallo-hydrolase [Chloroflexia bacterium]